MDTKYLCSIPILIVNDPTKSRDFYISKLGFKISFEWGEPLTYLGVKRNDVEIHLNASANSPHEAGKATISIITNEVDELFEYCRRNGVETTIEPADREYGLRDFGVKDIDGNVINFGCYVALK